MVKRNRVRIETLLEEGGEHCIALLRYCVMSVTMEIVFVYLAKEYRTRPSHAGVLALYDVFCAPQAPARIDARSTLPPYDLCLKSAVDAIRMQWQQLQQTPCVENRVPATAPLRNLFDPVVDTLVNDRRGGIAHLRRRYDPSRSPFDNLPGGAMTPGQRAFVERVWKPVARPRLVAAGFWRIETIE